MISNEELWMLIKLSSALGVLSATVLVIFLAILAPIRNYFYKKHIRKWRGTNED